MYYFYIIHRLQTTHLALHCFAGLVYMTNFRNIGCLELPHLDPLSHMIKHSLFPRIIEEKTC